MMLIALLCLPAALLGWKRAGAFPRTHFRHSLALSLIMAFFLVVMGFYTDIFPEAYIFFERIFMLAAALIMSLLVSELAPKPVRAPLLGRAARITLTLSLALLMLGVEARFIQLSLPQQALLNFYLFSPLCCLLFAGLMLSWRTGLIRAHTAFAPPLCLALILSMLGSNITEKWAAS